MWKHLCLVGLLVLSGCAGRVSDRAVDEGVDLLEDIDRGAPANAAITTPEPAAVPLNPVSVCLAAATLSETIADRVTTQDPEDRPWAYGTISKMRSLVERLAAEPADTWFLHAARYEIAVDMKRILISAVRGRAALVVTQGIQRGRIASSVERAGKLAAMVMDSRGIVQAVRDGSLLAAEALAVCSDRLERNEGRVSAALL